jgi:hypothetical protein
MKVNPITRSGLADTPVGAYLGIAPNEYGEFLVRLFDAWIDDPGFADFNKPDSSAHRPDPGAGRSRAVSTL